MTDTVAIFKPYPFTEGEKIRLEGGRRAGDWLVVKVEENTLTLQCPISKKEFTWKKFCYFTEQKEGTSWPLTD